MLETFTLGALERLLDRLRDGRVFATFRDTANGDLPSGFVLLRHDIDFSLEKALAFAEWEARRRIRATYFLLVDSNRYNLFASSWSEIPRVLAGC
jgi:hypothetical protein